MKVSIERLNDAVHFEGVNANGNTIHMDGSPAIGGEDKGVRPMELLLFATASCSCIDIVMILEKMKQPLKDLKVDVEGERGKDQVPSVFNTIHLHYKFWGDLKEDKVKKALELSLEKYCSVSAMLEQTAKITYEYSINPAS